MPMRLSRVLPVVVLLSAVSCGGSASDGLTGTGNTDSMPLSATIDGSAWGSPAPSATYRNSIVSIAGIDAGLTSAVALAVAATAPGTFSLAFGNNTGGFATISRSGKGWTSGVQGGAGSVTITTLTSNHVVGTFAFDAPPATGGASGTVHVTNGKFNITF
jgi:hypothetical protein